MGSLTPEEKNQFIDGLDSFVCDIIEQNKQNAVFLFKILADSQSHLNMPYDQTVFQNDVVFKSYFTFLLHQMAQNT